MARAGQSRAATRMSRGRMEFKSAP
jgi:hypothetical protein